MADNQFWRDASGRLVFEMFRVPADSYVSVRDDVVKAFELLAHTNVVSNGCDIIFQDFRRGAEIVGLEWDNWTGFTVVAKEQIAETLVQEISVFLLASPWAHLPSTIP